MKKPTPWDKLLEELSDPVTVHIVDVPALVALMSDERAKHYRTYARNAVAMCINKYMDDPNLTPSQMDFYRGAAYAYRSMMNLKANLEWQEGTKSTQPNRPKPSGGAGY